MTTSIRRPPAAEAPAPATAQDFGDLFDWDLYDLCRGATMQFPLTTRASSRSSPDRSLSPIEDSTFRARGDSPGSSDLYENRDTTSSDSLALTPTSTSVESGEGLFNDGVRSRHVSMGDAQHPTWTAASRQQPNMDFAVLFPRNTLEGTQHRSDDSEIVFTGGDSSSPFASVGAWTGSPQSGSYSNPFHAIPTTHFPAHINPAQDSAGIMTAFEPNYHYGPQDLVLRPAQADWHLHMAQPRQMHMVTPVHPAMAPMQQQPDPFMPRLVNPLATSVVVPSNEQDLHLRSLPGGPQERHPQNPGLERTSAAGPSSTNRPTSSVAARKPVVSRRPIARAQAQHRSGHHHEPVPQVTTEAPIRANITAGVPRLRRAGRNASTHGPEPAPAAARVAPYPAQRRGGRAPGGRLEEDVREQSNSMRRKGACWVCRLQRDPCDHGDPCVRCVAKSQRGQLYFITCDRSKLPSFVQDFLPTSLTYFHQKQSIEDTVAGQVLDWNASNGVQVLLTSSYGPPLPWIVYEFVPRSHEFLSQVHYRQDFNTGKEVSEIRWSPPFGLLKLDSSDDGYFDQYLDRLLLAEHLENLGKDFYREESRVDASRFQENLLQLMCDMFMQLESPTAKTQLREVIRMLIVTYIMSHTLTIEQSTLSEVLSQVRLTPVPKGVANTRHVSLRLANRQLKYFLSIIRDRMCNQILKHFQATLRINSAQSKTSTWLESFCVMLGLAMVLEEIQRTLMIQRDVDISRQLQTPQRADEQCANACQRIDERYQFLIGLFQCKYRDRTWGENGSFGPGTPELYDVHVREFLSDARQLLESSREHLESRRNVAWAPENQCLYTTRLTARFLLPFLELGST